MELFTQENVPPTPNPVIQEGLDTEAHNRILTKLCEGRKALEWNLENRDDSSREDYAIALIKHKEEMETFGISEVDYQTYLAKNKDTVH